MRKYVKDYILYKNIYNIYMIKKMNKPKKKSKHQKGGEAIQDVINASRDIVSSMGDLAKSIYTEINEITQIGSQLNLATSSSKGVPNQMNGPPSFSSPN